MPPRKRRSPKPATKPPCKFTQSTIKSTSATAGQRLPARMDQEEEASGKQGVKAWLRITTM
jgi:hypothetical protein